jgi:hypothetical protein
MEAEVGTGEDKRRAGRRMRTLKKGTVVFNGGYSVYDCVVRNLSDGGAMLQISGLGIPTHFELAMDSTKQRRACTVRWRTDNALGVSFDDVGPKAA